MKATLFAAIILASGLVAWKYKPTYSLPGKAATRTAAVPVTPPPATAPLPVTPPRPARDNTRIQVALLLDTSNSMDGLIDQAKSRLWNIINTLTTLKFNGKTPDIEIALYEYGNDGLGAASSFIRQVTPLSTDLDLISEKLFALRTNGGSEYCGMVISKAVKSLEWGQDEADLKLIYIAGNEPFNQGEVHYSIAAGEALHKNIYINTIFCGDYTEGISTKWKDGADKGQGKYFNIDSDRKVRFIETPYDSLIASCNDRMNQTYIGYGAHGESKKSSQLSQDANAQSVSKMNFTERTVSKSKSVYRNDSWDLVERSQKDKTFIQNMTKSELPKELRDKSVPEIQKIVAAKSRERDSVQKVIGELGKKRQQFIDEAAKKSGTPDDLGTAINRSIIQLAATKGYKAEL